jgi:hypothetical protein
MPAIALAIVVSRDGLVVSAHELAGDVVRIGRNPTCEIPLADERVSALHASLERSGEGWCIVERSSSDSLRLHTQGDDEGWLAVGDVIEIPPFMLQVVAPSELASTRAALEQRSHPQREPLCSACGRRAKRIVTELHTDLRAPTLVLDDPDAFTKLRAELCSACGHLSLFVRDPRTIVPE